MRYLLEQDNLEYNSLKKFISENWNNRPIDTTKPSKQFYFQYTKDRVERDLLKYKLKGINKTETHIILEWANEDPEYIADESFITVESDKFSVAQGTVYHVGGEFAENLNKLKHFEKLINLAIEYFKSEFSLTDIRNLYESDNGIYYGTRDVNKDDANLLGSIVGGTFLLSSDEYNKVLIEIKESLQS